MTLSADPPQTAADQRTLPELIASTGLGLTDQQVDRLIAYRELLHEQNAKTNLTAVRDIPGMDRRLILESLRLVTPLRNISAIDETSRRTMLDIGTGGGLPGMVLAIAFPEIESYLLDATGKKVAFLELVKSELELENVIPIHGRAEELGHQPRYRNAFDIITARAVSSIPALLELGLPMLRTNGTMLLPKGTDIDDELAAGHRANKLLRGEIVADSILPDAGSSIETRLIEVRKTATTPAKYPRRSGIPSRNPLGSVHTDSNDPGGF